MAQIRSLYPVTNMPHGFPSFVTGELYLEGMENEWFKDIRN